jgi:DNA modification methylase
MFPLEFAFDIVSEYSEAGEIVLDPFAGRGSSIYAAANQGRYGVGFEINPVGWIYSQAKLAPAKKRFVIKRLQDINEIANDYRSNDLPPFFRACFSPTVLSFLLAARENLNWKRNKSDRTLMALLLIYLHGKYGQTLSNQMNHTKSMWPEYSIRWWNEKNLKPPKINCYEFLLQRIEWRYQKGLPSISDSKVYLGDSTKILGKSYNNFSSTLPAGKVSLLFTSPPYKGVTNYHKDQWLRLWLLGGSSSPTGESKKHKGRFDSEKGYKELLLSVFSKVAPLMAKEFTVYVRTSTRKITYETTLCVLEECFPKARQESKESPFQKKTQTTLIGNKSSAPSEVDIIITNR